MSETATTAPAQALPLVLPSELTIYTVSELLPQWLAWLGAEAAVDGPARVEAGDVAEIDGAGLQMLVSLQRALAARGRALELVAPSRVLQDACAGAGLTDLAPAVAEGA